jgi:PAS domain S-box-containing protein
MSKLLARICALWSHSVRNKLVISVALVHAVLMSVFVFDMVERQQSFLRNEEVARADTLVRTLAVSSASGVLSNDISGLEEIIGAMQNMPDLSYACILDPSGRVLAHTRRELEGLYAVDPLSLSLLARAPGLQHLIVANNQIDLAMPVVTGSRMLGWVRIGLAKSARQSNLVRVAQDGMAYASIAILVGGLFALGIGGRLSAGLDKLVAAVDAVRAGDRSIKAEEGADEIGRLGTGFNSMLEAVRAGEEKFRTVADFTYDWEYWLGPEGGLVWMSPSCEQLTGYTAEDFQRDAGLLRRIVHQEDQQLFETHMCEVALGGATRGALDFRVTHRSGRIIWIDHHCQSITRPDGTVLGRRVSNRDITLRRRAEDEVIRSRDAAQAANKAKGDFLAVMSHELRTPLNGIKGMLQLLREVSLTESERADCLKHALAASGNLALILDDLLDVTRLESGRLAIIEEPFQLKDVAEPVCASVESVVRAKGLRLVHSIHPELLGTFFGDAVRIRQILLNLLGNAVKFSHSGQVSLDIYPLIGPSAMRAQGRVPVHFVVSDSGIGIAQEHLLDIFEPFTQLESPYTRMHGGVGLGLAIVKRLTTLLGGRLDVYSEPGQGTEVHLTLALGRVPTEAQEPTLFRDKQYMKQATKNLEELPPQAARLGRGE